MSGVAGGAVRPEVPPAQVRRLAWLDALRGIAALAVVFDHLMYATLQPVREAVTPWFGPGQYGVFVFFLISGYIVPASLDRKGSVRAFWISRVFRLYPVYLLAVGALALLTWLGLGSMGGASQHPASSALGQLLMLPNLLGVPDAPYTVWTLSYEMVFYLLLTVLFTARVHRRTGAFAGIALGFAAAALAVGGMLPTTALSGGVLGTKGVAAAADVLIVCGLGLAMSRRRLPAVLGAAVAALTALALTAGNGATYPGEALTILALMFAGTVFYRAEHGEMGAGRAVAIITAVFGFTVASGLWQSLSWHHMSPAAVLAFQHRWVTTLVLAGLTFAVGMALRHRKVPAFLAWLGLISYSVYLLHPLLLGIFQRLPWGYQPFSVHVAAAAAFVAVVIACSALSYRFVEAPAQRAGKRLARRWDVAQDPGPAHRPAMPSGDRRRAGADGWPGAAGAHPAIRDGIRLQLVTASITVKDTSPG